MVVTLVTRNGLGTLGCLAVLAALQAGCGQVVTPAPGTPGAGGDPGSGSLVTDASLAPGTCGVVRRFTAPGAAVYRADALPTRQPGGFSFGPWSDDLDAQELNGFMLDESGASRAFRAQGGVNDVRWPLFLGTSGKLLDVFVGEPVMPGGASNFEGRTWSNGDTAPSQGGKLLEAVWRGSDRIVARPTLDGNGAVFAIWPTSISQPQATLVNTEGRAIGAARLLAPVDHISSRCEAVTPTEHGGIISFFDVGANQFRMVELGGDADAIDASFPDVPQNSQGFCPLVALGETGVFVLTPPQVDGAWRLLPVYGGGYLGSTTLTPQRSPEAFTPVPQGTLVLERGVEGAMLEFWNESEVRSFEVPDLRDYSVVSSEPGRIFVAQQQAKEANTILELGCR